MLTQIADPLAALGAITDQIAERVMLKSFLARHADIGMRATSLVDDPAYPRALAVYAGVTFKVFASRDALKRLVADLFAQRIRQQPPWPVDSLQAAWNEAGQPILRLNQVRESVWRAFLAGGFELAADRKNTENAYLFQITGAPRFRQMVQHPCRLGRGIELLELVRQGIDYDESGERTRRSLLLGPSFVCEVDCQPVCWSATHPGGLMGMIYTPPEHRRKGYARSLAAFQIDHMLKRDGYACALVLEENTPSQELLGRFGAERLAERVGWRTVCWPDKISDVEQNNVEEDHVIPQGS